MYILAYHLNKIGDYEAAEPIFREAIIILQDNFSNEHLHTNIVKFGLGGCLTQLKQYNEAEIYLLESFSFMREKRGIKDRFTKNVISSIIKLYKAWGKPDKVKEYEALLPDTTDVSH